MVLDRSDTISEFSIQVKNPMKDTLSASFGLKRICINLTHPDLYQVDVWLVSPDNVVTKLMTGLFGGDINACFEMSSTNYVTNNWGPFSGTLRPVANFGILNNGGKVAGTWKLRIRDKFPGAFGTLKSWSITFAQTAPQVLPLVYESKLPVIRINTRRNVIVDDPKRIVEFELIDNKPGKLNKFDDSATFKEKIAIEIRGSSSQWFPKKSYAFEFVDSAGMDKKVSLLDMPAQSDWILSANFTDKSFLNNVLAYDLFRTTELYASRTRFVDLVIDGEPQGLYVLMEKIKQDKQRVNISKLTPLDTSNSDLTGGYIFKIDKSTAGDGDGWASNFSPTINPNNQIIYFQYHDPKGIELLPVQKKYIQQYMDSFEISLMNESLNQRNKGWRQYADEASFINYFLLNEISRNTDGYRLSTFLYKDKTSKGGKIVIGPPWDYDIAFGNINYCYGERTDGWAVDFGNVCPGDNWQIPFWWEKMLQDTLFINALQCQYTKLRNGIWSNDSLNVRIQNYIQQIRPSALQNFSLWAILGVYIWPNPGPLPSTFDAEVTELKTWLFNRLNWIDKNLFGQCIISESKDLKDKLTNVNVYPNPALDQLNVNVQNQTEEIKELRILNIQGRILQVNKNINAKNISIPINDILPGHYFLEILFSDRSKRIEKIFIMQ